MVRVVLYQPDIPQNTGTILRTGACLGVGIDIIEPAGFDLSAKAFRRAGLDYLSLGDWRRFGSWQSFLDDAAPSQGPSQKPEPSSAPVTEPATDAERRLVLLSTRGGTAYTQFRFRRGDRLVLGRESSGVPTTVREQCDAVVTVPQIEGTRSLNVAVAAAMVLGEALRQLR